MLNVNTWNILKDVVLFFKKNHNIKERVKKIANTLFIITASDLYVLYEVKNDEISVIEIKSNYKIERTLTLLSSFIIFILESKEITVTNKKNNSFLDEMLLSSKMNSSIAIPITVKNQVKFLIILNSKKPNFYDSEIFFYLNNFIDFIKIYFE